eukprot:1159682-Pelagomonas_calceolata.AAC.1
MHTSTYACTCVQLCRDCSHTASHAALHAAPHATSHATLQAAAHAAPYGAGARGDTDPDWKKKPSERAKKEPKSPRPW